MFECDECGRAFRSERGLKSHMRTHADETDAVSAYAVEPAPEDGLKDAEGDSTPVDAVSDGAGEDASEGDVPEVDGFHGAMWRATMMRRGVTITPTSESHTGKGAPTDPRVILRRLDTGGI